MVEILQEIALWIVVLQITGYIFSLLIKFKAGQEQGGGSLALSIWPLLVLISAILGIWDRTRLFVHWRTLSQYLDAPTGKQAEPDYFRQVAWNKRVWYGEWKRSRWYFFRIYKDHGLTVGRAKHRG